jgi:hypothetical protein
MTNDLQQRLEEYQKFVARETRFATEQEFLEFSKDKFVYYKPDFGMHIQSLVATNKDLIDFIQRVCIDDWYEDSGGSMWFVNDSSANQYVDFNPETAQVEWIIDDEDEEYRPTELVESYYVDYNPFYDKPFAVIKDAPEDRKMVFKDGDLIVKPEISAKMPFIARFVSHDTFDRLGSIKGWAMDIIQLKDLASGKIMFV